MYDLNKSWKKGLQQEEDAHHHEATDEQHQPDRKPSWIKCKDKRNYEVSVSMVTGWWRWWWCRAYLGWGQCALDSGCPQQHSTWLFHYPLWDFYLSMSQEGRPGPSPQCYETLGHNTTSTERATAGERETDKDCKSKISSLNRTVWLFCSHCVYLQGESDVNCHWSCHCSKTKKCSWVAIRKELQVIIILLLCCSLQVGKTLKLHCVLNIISL